MRLVKWILMVVLTVNDIWCEDTMGSSAATMKPKVISVSCVLNNVTDTTPIRSFCESQTSNQTFINILLFKDSHFEVFPKIFDHFSNLHSVDLSNAGIKHIDSTTFNNANSLTSLYMYGSNVSTLSNYIFSRANNLSSLDFGNSSIVKIENNAFEGLSNLKKMDLSYNMIKHLEAAIFHPLHSLEVIRLTNNKIEVIDKDTFSNNVHLRLAYFCTNNIVIVDPNSFIFTELRSLDLGFNNLTDLDLSTQSNLTTLNVANNNLNTLIVPPTADEIHAENNTITVIRSNEQNKLKKLFLSSNHLDNLKNLPNFGTLEFLDLSKNQFRAFEFSDLKSLIKLKELKLTGNRLGEINASDVVTNLPSLQMIELSTAHWSKDFVSKLSDELRDHKIFLVPGRNEIPDNGTTDQPPRTTETPKTSTSNIPTTTSKVPTKTSTIPTSTSTGPTKTTDLPLPDPQSENVEKSLEKIASQLNAIEDDMKKSNSVNNAKYDALVSTFKTFEILLLIMFISGVTFILFKIIVLSRNALHNMRYRRAQSSDPLFSEQDL